MANPSLTPPPLEKVKLKKRLSNLGSKPVFFNSLSKIQLQEYTHTKGNKRPLKRKNEKKAERVGGHFYTKEFLKKKVLATRGIIKMTKKCHQLFFHQKNIYKKFIFAMA